MGRLLRSASWELVILGKKRLGLSFYSPRAPRPVMGRLLRSASWGFVIFEEEESCTSILLSESTTPPYGATFALCVLGVCDFDVL